MLMAVAVTDVFVRFGGLPSFGPVEWASVLVSSSVSAVMLASIVFLLGDAYWFVCVPAFVWGLSCSGVEWFFRRFFSANSLHGEDLIVAILTLSQEKVAAFVCECGTVGEYVAYAVGVVAVLLAVAWMTSRSVGRPTRRSFVGGLILFVGMNCLMPFAMDHDHLMSALLHHKFVRVGDKVSMYCDLSKGGEKLPDGSYVTTSTNLLAVIVIGESSTRSHWSLYGYSRPTTPRLAAQADRLLVFSNVTATVALTPYALRDLFSTQAESRIVSVPSAAVAAGYAVSLCSGQAKMGEFEGSDELLFAACGTRQYLCERLSADAHYDGELLPFVQQAVTSAAPAQLVFVHTYGSHIDWASRFPPAFARFSADLVDKEVEGLPQKTVRRVNAYDNSILYTDFVVSELLSMVQAQEKPAVFVYVADHGESPHTLARDHNHPDTHAIPFFIWMSDSYRLQHRDCTNRLLNLRNQALTAKDLFPIFMELLGLSKQSREGMR